MREIKLKKAGILLISVVIMFSIFYGPVRGNTVTVPSKTKILCNSLSKNGWIRSDIIWDNGGSIPDGTLYSSQLDEIYPFLSQVADDFKLMETMLITDVHWYGGVWGMDEFDPCDFWIYFYADNGTGDEPTGGGLSDPSSTAIWAGFYPAVTGLPLDQNGFYSYEVAVIPPFTAVGGVKYWMSIQAVFSFPPQWGQVETDQIHLHSAVQGFPYIDVPFWTDVFFDMAFYLIGEPAIQPKPDLNYTGSLEWTQIKPGASVYGEFSIENSGELGSLLDWEVESYPTWGTWIFTPSSGSDLAAGSMVMVNVTCIAPDEKPNEFSGNITIINVENTSDYCIIPVYLKTPKNTGVLFLQFLERFVTRFPHAFPILRSLMGY